MASSPTTAAGLLLLLATLLQTASASDDNPITQRFQCRPNGCCDHHEWCRFWASVGECRGNRDWMAENCQLACGTCTAPIKNLRRPAPRTLRPKPRPRFTTRRQPPQKKPTTKRPSPFRSAAGRPPPITRFNVRMFRPRHGEPPTTPSRPFIGEGLVRTRPPPITTTPRTTLPPLRLPFDLPGHPRAQHTTRRLFPFTFAPIPRTITPPPLEPIGDILAQCAEIGRSPSDAAQQLIQKRLIFPREDQSGRSTALSLDIVVRSNLANACVPRNDEAECQRSLCYNLYFRTFDGTCNNLQKPLQGAAFRPYNRLLPAVYDNGLSEPVSSLNPTLRPNPRDVNRFLLSTQTAVLSGEYNALLMQFGQFISHDMAKTTLVPSSKCNVCQNITSRCMSVPISRDDHNRNFKDASCIRVSRSSPVCGSGRSLPRQQNNENTAYIDASPIYGSSMGDLKKFRQGDTAFLKMPMFRGEPTLPFDQSQCRSKRNCKVTFVAGDSRVNLFVGLTSMHYIFTKEHNRLATLLKRINPHWNDERLFMESRKILGAQVQAIVYREYLPKILGASFEQTVGPYEGYDPSVDATVANEFTSAAFRFGHGMIQGGPDRLIRGMMIQNVKRPQRLTTAITENMFGSTDLGTINIQRGRDHAHPGYVRYRELCGLGRATTWDHLGREIMNTELREKMARIYGTVDRVDLFVGALLEEPVVRGLVGPTISCIVGPQFKRTRDGDRFYYENPGIFTPAQLAEIRRSSLSRIICDNAETPIVPREAFRVGHMTPCSQIPSMDLNKWRD